MKQKIYILAIALPMTSCGIYTKYEHPETNTSGLYRAELSADTTTSLAGLHWDKLFTDPQLQHHIREGLQANTDLHIARLKVEEAQAALHTARLAHLPSIQIDPQGSLSAYGSTPPDKNYTLGASASWEIDIFGKLANARREARAVLEQSDAYRQAVQTSLVATIAENYYMLLMLDEQEDITAETLDSWDEYLHTLRALMQAGEANRSTLNQAEANRLSVQNSLADLRLQITELENSLSATLGRKPGHIARTTLQEQTFPDTLSIGVPMELLSMRPDIRQAQASLEQHFYISNTARAAFYPSITLSGAAGWTNSGAPVANPESWLWQAVGSLVQPLFNRGTNIANLKIAKAQQEQALLSYHQTLLDTGVEVNNAVTRWQTARKKVEADRRQVEHLQTVVDDTRLLMHHGSVNYLEVLLTRQSLLTARLGLVNDRRTEMQSVIELYHALGGGKDREDKGRLPQ